MNAARTARRVLAPLFFGVSTLGLLCLGCSGSSSRSVVVGGTAAPVASGTAPVTTTINGSFSALTYNVAGLPQGLSSSNPTVNTPQISPKLNRYDLVLAQEDFTYHTLLALHTTHPFQSTPQAAFMASIMNDGLNRFSQSPYSDFQRVTWSSCHGLVGNANDCLAAKGFTVARHTMGPGVVIDVYNLHADAGNDPGDVNARTQQLAQLAQFMSAYSTGNPVIVAGDTNLRETRPPDLVILNDFKGITGLTDVGKQLGMPDHIDRFLYRDGTDVFLTPSQWRVADEFIDSAGNDLSDHPAIHVDFAWRRR